MKRLFAGLGLIGILLLGALAAPVRNETAGKGEGFRELIEMGVDRGTIRIPDKAVPTTLERIRAEVRPDDFLIGAPTLRYAEGRILGFENQEWQVDAVIRKVWLDDEGNIRMILMNRPTEAVQAVCPNLKDFEKRLKEEGEDEDEVAKDGGKFRKAIERAYDDLIAKLHPTAEAKDVDVNARLEGLGFFGKPIVGNACQNGAQLRPITGVEFK